jgi:hypothetical protein
MILLLLALALIQVALLMPAWVYSRRHGRLFSWDYSLAVLPLAVWVLLVSFGMGPQSLSNLIELPIVSLVVVVLYYARVFFLDRMLQRHRAASIVTVALSTLFPLALRLSMPLLPE